MSSLMKRRVRGDMIAGFWYLWGSAKKVGINLLSQVPEDKSRCLLKRAPIWNLKKTFLSRNNQWNSSPLKVVGDPALEVFKK